MSPAGHAHGSGSSTGSGRSRSSPLGGAGDPPAGSVGTDCRPGSAQIPRHPSSQSSPSTQAEWQSESSHIRPAGQSSTTRHSTGTEVCAPSPPHESTLSPQQSPNSAQASSHQQFPSGAAPPHASSQDPATPSAKPRPRPSSLATSSQPATTKNTPTIHPHLPTPLHYARWTPRWPGVISGASSPYTGECLTQRSKVRQSAVSA